MADALNDRLLPAELLSESAPVKIRHHIAQTVCNLRITFSIAFVNENVQKCAILLS